MNDFDEAIQAISQEQTVHPGDRNRHYLHKNHPVRFVLEHAANNRDIRDDGTRVDYGYADHLENAGFGDYTELVDEAVTKIRSHTRTGNHGTARRLADKYVADIAANHLTSDERTIR